MGAGSNTCNATKQALDFDTTKTDNRYNVASQTKLERNIQVLACRESKVHPNIQIHKRGID